MFLGFEFRPHALWSARPVWMIVLAVGCISVRAAVPDSLSLRDKAQINKLAELLLVGEYKGVLSSITSLSVESESDAADLEGLVEGTSQGDGRIFIGPDAMIQDNIDPDVKAGTPGLDRKVAVYANDFFMYFRGEGTDPVSIRLLDRSEPMIRGEFVQTKLLYEVALKGRHKEKSTPYAPQKRVMRFIAEQVGTRDWKVYIAADDFYDEAQGFTSYQFENQVQAAQATGTLTPEMLVYQESARRAEEEAERAREEKKKRFAEAIDVGNKLLADGAFDEALEVYKQAAKIDPLSIEPVIRAKRTEKARIEKEQNDKRQYDELIDRGRKLQEMREYQRALDSYQSAAAIYPADQRCRPRIDSLEALVKAKAERERFYYTPDYAGSVAECQRLLREPARKDDPELMTLLAMSLAKQGDKKREEALRWLDKVIQKEPHFAEALRTRAQLQERNGDVGVRAAIQDYSVLKTFDKWDMRNYHRYAMLLCNTAKRCPEANEVLKDALKREPGNPETYYLLARVNSVDGLKRYPEALENLDHALKRDSLCSECWLEKAIVLLQGDSIEQAVEAVALAQRLSLEPEFAARADSMAAFNLTQARSLEASQGFEDADRSYMRACILKPTDPGLRFRKAKNLMRIQKWAEAIEDLDIHIRQTDGPYQALLDRANCKLKLGMYKESRDDVAGILGNHIEKYASYANLVAGQAAYYMEDLPSAEAHFKEALRLDLPDDPSTDPKDLHNRQKNEKANRFMSQIAMRSGRLKDAKDYAKEAVKLDQRNKENHMNLGLALQAMGDRNGSVASFEEAFRLGADNAEVRKLIGRSFMLAGDWKEALGQFAQQKPLRDDKDVYFWAAECHERLKQFPEALGELNQLLAKFPEVETQPEFLARLAYLYVITDNGPSAKEYFDKAERIDNKHKATLLYRSTYLWKNDQQNEAVKQLGELVDRGIILESDMKDRPVLEDIRESKLWKNRVPK